MNVTEAINVYQSALYYAFMTFYWQGTSRCQARVRTINSVYSFTSLCLLLGGLWHYTSPLNWNRYSDK